MRIGFNYFLDEETFDYVVRAVELTAEGAAALLPWYRFDPTSGLWRHRDAAVAAPMSLHDVNYDGNRMSFPLRTRRTKTRARSRS